jgi:hypothetical protein
MSSREERHGPMLEDRHVRHIEDSPHIHLDKVLLPASAGKGKEAAVKGSDAINMPDEKFMVS